MKFEARWITDLPIRSKLRLLGTGTVVPFLLLLFLSLATYLAITAEAEKTVDLGRRGDAALEAGAHIDTLLLVQNTLHRLSTRASDPPGGVLDESVMDEAGGSFAEFDKIQGELSPKTLGPVEADLREFRRQFLEVLPRLMEDRLQTRRQYEDEFTRLEALTYDYQDQLTAVADAGVLLAQTRYMFAVLTVLQNRRQAYLDDRAQAVLEQRKTEWLAVAKTPRYAGLAAEFLGVQASLIPTLEAWLGEQSRLDLAKLRYTEGQRVRSEAISRGLTQIKQTYLAQVQAGLGERALTQTNLRNQNLSTLVGLAGLGLAGVLVLLWILALFERGLVAPLSLATAWAARIRDGDYQARLALDRRDEFGTLALALDHMALVVSQKTEESDTLNRTLELTVIQRTEHLTRTLKNLEEAQARLVNSEKLAVLGTLAAGMAHELNTPLAAILSADRSILDFFRDRYSWAQATYDSLPPGDKETYRLLVNTSFTRDRLDRARPSRPQLRSLIESLTDLGVEEAASQAEVWVDLGLWTDQELHQSLAALPRAREILALAMETTSLRKMSQIIEEAGIQASRVVAALKPYMVLGPEETPMEKLQEFPLKAALLAAIDMIGHHHFRKVELHWNVPDDLSLQGSQATWTQVWINLINNALQAMSYQGVLGLEAEGNQEGWTMRIRDTGPGIPPEWQQRIFEPFFTSKKNQGGMGLGLDICRRLVEGRGGRLSFTSTPGNTVFEVWVPRRYLTTP